MKNVFTYAVKSLNAPKVNFLKKGLQMLIGADRCEVAIVAFSNSGNITLKFELDLVV